MSDFGIETISEDEYRRAQLEIAAARGSTREIITEPRTRVVWFSLPTDDGHCTVPEHSEIQQTLSPQALAYRAMYPTRQVFEIKPGLLICRDCFLASADKERTDDG